MKMQQILMHSQINEPLQVPKSARQVELLKRMRKDLTNALETSRLRKSGNESIEEEKTRHDNLNHSFIPSL